MRECIIDVTPVGITIWWRDVDKLSDKSIVLTQEEWTAMVDEIAERICYDGL